LYKLEDDLQEFILHFFAYIFQNYMADVSITKYYVT